ncbi:hypothetical protein LF1_14470 [Rubripirellula obstinata]|uniref:Uncharacterized protein n=2 Tax=Rubripirellula obstinata TaxID=406547 RepID=A0A5B1CHC6_9BACT|nr:hypothetical protein LF1_14470 [Rubripirellula obstinata]
MSDAQKMGLATLLGLLEVRELREKLQLIKLSEAESEAVSIFLDLLEAIASVGDLDTSN